MSVASALTLTGVVIVLPCLGTGLWFLLGDEEQPWWTKPGILLGCGLFIAAAWCGVGT